SSWLQVRSASASAVRPCTSARTSYCSRTDAGTLSVAAARVPAGSVGAGAPGVTCVGAWADGATAVDSMVAIKYLAILTYPTRVLAVFCPVFRRFSVFLVAGTEYGSATCASRTAAVNASKGPRRATRCAGACASVSATVSQVAGELRGGGAQRRGDGPIPGRVDRRCGTQCDHAQHHVTVGVEYRRAKAHDARQQGAEHPGHAVLAHRIEHLLRLGHRGRQIAA